MFALIEMFFWLILTIVFAIAGIVGVWQTMEKAGEGGWASLIPYYRTYILCKIGGKPKNFIPIAICSAVNALTILVSGLIFFQSMYEIGMGRSPSLAIIVWIFFAAFVLAVTKIIKLVFKYLYSMELAKKFGEDEWFAVGLTFLPYVFYIILGFGKNSKYQNIIETTAVNENTEE